MKQKNKVIFCILLVLAVCLGLYLVAQILIPEPITRKLTNLAHPSHNAARTLVEAYLDNQPDTVRDLLSRTRRNRIFHDAALSERELTPEQAMHKHTSDLSAFCSDKIKNKVFYLTQMDSFDANRMPYEVRQGTLQEPGPKLLHLVMLREEDGSWRCDEIVKIH